MNSYEERAGGKAAGAGVSQEDTVKELSAREHQRGERDEYPD